MGGRAAQQVLWAGVCLAPLQVILILRVLSRWDFFLCFSSSWWSPGEGGQHLEGAWAIPHVALWEGQLEWLCYPES